MKYRQLPVELFEHNRRRFIAAMQPNTLAIFNSNDQMPRNGDCYYPFRQNSDLLWLSGIDQEETILLLYPNCPKGAAFDAVLAIKRTNDHIAVWEGHKYTQDEARAASGINKIIWLDELPALLRELLLLADAVYLNTNENDRAVIEVPTRDERMAAELRTKYPAHTWLRAQPILKRLRTIKSEYEIEVLREAIRITEQAFRRVLRTAQPGMAEYEIEAEITYEFLRNRANGHAYTPIIAGGANACVLHYTDNNAILRQGDVLLMDFGAEYANYAADLTRCIPIGGKFSPRQRQVYEAVWRVLQGATTMLVPGNNLTDYHRAVGQLMEAELLQLGLITQQDIEQQNPDWPAYKKYFMHGTSHHLGLDVHDLMMRYAPFEAGMVFTCEPGIYIPEEGLGIRLENDILITDNGPVDLMASIPLHPEDIERLMAESTPTTTP